ncbi:MAG TPA: DNA alkylation repair protein [Microthrixaceae bacterium]|nr:DNA alkylation repair protein [Microthrixaceae bacterium]
MSEIDAGLTAAADPSRAERERSYLKSTLGHLGCSVPAIRSVAVSFRRGHPELSHSELVSLVEELWSHPVHEHRMACVELLAQFQTLLSADDMMLLERLLREARTWAIVDGLSTSVVGRVVERDGDAADVLDRWSTDDDCWIRRASLLALLVPLRRGAGDFDRFGRYADCMLDEQEFFIRKAIGWVLRDTAKKRPDLVLEWLLPRCARASGVTIREAIKPLTEAQRQSILDAR